MENNNPILETENSLKENQLPHSLEGLQKAEVHEEISSVEEAYEETGPVDATPVADRETTDSNDVTGDASGEKSYNVKELLASDLQELRQEFPELNSVKDITELQNPSRYAALRDLGLTPKEAYLATTPQNRDNRTHLRTSPSSSARPPISSMTGREWQIARSLFENMSDSEIEKLYKKVTK